MTWIKLYRQIQDSEIWNGKEPFDRRSAWIDLLILASHNERRVIIMNQPAKLNRGDFVASIRFLMKRWKWGNPKTQAYLGLLIELKMISKISTPVGTGPGTIYHITNYDTYQDRDSDSRYTNRYATGTPPVRHRYETKKGKNIEKEEEDRRFSSPGSEEINRSNLGFTDFSEKNVSEKQKRPESKINKGGPLARFREKCESLGLNPFDEYQRTKGDITKIGKREEG